MPASVILLYIRMLSTVMSREPDWTPSVVVRVSPRPTVGGFAVFYLYGIPLPGGADQTMGSPSSSQADSSEGLP